jgi:hypothetical protein
MPKCPKLSLSFTFPKYGKWQNDWKVTKTIPSICFSHKKIACKTFIQIYKCSNNMRVQNSSDCMTLSWLPALSSLLSVSCLAYSTTLWMEATCSSEMSLSLPTTQHYNPEDHNLHSHHHENLKSSMCRWCLGPLQYDLCDFLLTLCKFQSNVWIQWI